MGIFSNNTTEKNIDITKIKLPEHLGIIMDGNGRWAKKRGLPRSAGHSAGAKTFRTITRYCSDIGIKHLTLYAFSTENWTRPPEEVSALMKYFKDYLEEALRDFLDDTVKIKFIGDISAFPDELRELMEENERVSKDRSGMVLNLAMNYGGRSEIVYACRKIAKMAANGEISPENIDEKLISDNIYTAGQPDPDFIIRPSGEYRTSNFLLWQSAYAEYYIDDVLWPDYTKEHLNKALLEYSKRNRRFGGV
ncbi:MAG: isoprenyl transferase [Clostridia bacterium]|nr:isoprenyl transferase [Clostridia bacterium]